MHCPAAEDSRAGRPAYTCAAKGAGSVAALTSDGPSTEVQHRVALARTYLKGMGRFHLG
jgi:hypothetical protein